MYTRGATNKVNVQRHAVPHSNSSPPAWAMGEPAGGAKKKLTWYKVISSGGWVTE